MHYSWFVQSGTVPRVAPKIGLNEAVVNVLRTQRAATDVTIAELAERTHIPVVTVQRLLAGKRPLRLDTLDALCRGLHLSPTLVIALATHQPSPHDTATIRHGVR